MLELVVVLFRVGREVGVIKILTLLIQFDIVLLVRIVQIANHELGLLDIGQQLL